MTDFKQDFSPTNYAVNDDASTANTHEESPLLDKCINGREATECLVGSNKEENSNPVIRGRKIKFYQCVTSHQHMQCTQTSIHIITIIIPSGNELIRKQHTQLYIATLLGACQGCCTQIRAGHENTGDQGRT